MTFRRFIVFACILNVAFLFTKIYQHNHVARLKYRKQRLERSFVQLQAAYQTSQAQLYEKTTLARLNTLFQEREGMKPLKFAQIRKQNYRPLKPFDKLRESDWRAAHAEQSEGLHTEPFKVNEQGLEV